MSQIFSQDFRSGKPFKGVMVAIPVCSMFKVLMMIKLTQKTLKILTRYSDQAFNQEEGHFSEESKT